MFFEYFIPCYDKRFERHHLHRIFPIVFQLLQFARLLTLLSRVEFFQIRKKGFQFLIFPIKKFSNWPTIPQLYIHGEFIGGADIIKEMYETGELVKLLKANS